MRRLTNATNQSSHFVSKKKHQSKHYLMKNVLFCFRGQSSLHN